MPRHVQCSAELMSDSPTWANSSVGEIELNHSFIGCKCCISQKSDFDLDGYYSTCFWNGSEKWENNICQIRKRPMFYLQPGNCAYCWKIKLTWLESWDTLSVQGLFSSQIETDLSCHSSRSSSPPMWHLSQIISVRCSYCTNMPFRVNTSLLNLNWMKWSPRLFHGATVSQ